MQVFVQDESAAEHSLLGIRRIRPSLVEGPVFALGFVEIFPVAKDMSKFKSRPAGYRINVHIAVADSRPGEISLFNTFGLRIEGIRRSHSKINGPFLRQKRYVIRKKIHLGRTPGRHNFLVPTTRTVCQISRFEHLLLCLFVGFRQIIFFCIVIGSLHEIFRNYEPVTQFRTGFFVAHIRVSRVPHPCIQSLEGIFGNRDSSKDFMFVKLNNVIHIALAFHRTVFPRMVKSHFTCFRSKCKLKRKSINNLVMRSTGTEHRRIVIIYSNNILFTNGGFTVFRYKHIVRVEFVICSRSKIPFNNLANAIKRFTNWRNKGFAIKDMVTPRRFRTNDRRNRTVFQRIKFHKHSRNKANPIRERMAEQDLADIAFRLLSFFVFAILGCDFLEHVEIDFLALETLCKRCGIRRFNVIDDIAHRGIVKFRMTVIVLFRRWHLNLCFLDIELFQKSGTCFANNPLAMVRDKTFLNIIRNFNFGRRIGQIPVQHRKGFQGILMRLDIHCIGDLITEIHVGKGIRELVTMLIVIESQFIIAVHQAVHREQALINKRQKVVFQSHIVAS